MASEERSFGHSSWEENLDDTDHRNLQQKLISLANSRLSLDSVFKKYNITLEPTYSSTGWVYRRSCPFADHSDRRPSFGYNPAAGIFNCFGCHRGGKAVEFIAYMDERSRIHVAREIIGKYSDDELSLHNSFFDFEKLRASLFDFADTIRLFKISHGNDAKAVKYAKAVSWNLDVYLRKHTTPVNTIVLDELQARISKLKEQLEIYGESD